jgi:acyl-coenzyme A thioesterase PaaI-like protein
LIRPVPFIPARRCVLTKARPTAPNGTVAQSSSFLWMNPRSRRNTRPTMPAGAAGPANAEGLRIRSFLEGDAVVAEWKPDRNTKRSLGVLNGGIIGTLLDCHCNWTAAWHLMKQSGEDRVPCTVTADYAIKLLRPTPTNDSVSSLRQSGGIKRGPRHGRRQPDRRRKSLRNLPRDIRRRQGRSPGLPPLVIARRGHSGQRLPCSSPLVRRIGCLNSVDAEQADG